MTKHEYSSLSNISLSWTCFSSLVRKKNHTDINVCSKTYMQASRPLLYMCALLHGHTCIHRQILVLKGEGTCLFVFWEEFAKGNDVDASTLRKHKSRNEQAGSQLLKKCYLKRSTRDIVQRKTYKWIIWTEFPGNHREEKLGGTLSNRRPVMMSYCVIAVDINS